MKLNLGCGFNHLAGYVNVDQFDTCKPDLRVNLESFPWPWPDSSVDEVVMYHSLEHMGQSSSVFLQIMQELYRICAPEAAVKITVPHPRHDHFISDPTHVRVITPGVMSLFDKQQCDHFVRNRFSNTPLAHYLHLDFELANSTYTLDPHYDALMQNGQISQDELQRLAAEKNNVVAEITLTLITCKPIRS